VTNILLAKPLAATITAASAAATMPASNLALAQPTDVWRSTSLTSQYIEIDLGSAQAIDLVALMFTNLTSAGTWRVQAGTTTGVSNWDSGTVTAWAGSVQNVDRPHTLLYLGAAQTYRYWKITLTDAANPAGYFQAGRVVMASAFKPTRNYAYGAGRGFKDLSERKDTIGGNLLFETRAKRPLISVELNWLTATEAEATLLELQRLADGPVLLVTNPDASPYRMGRMYYGLPTYEPAIVAALNIYQTRISIEGLI
jgi:hypothetical protein